MALVGRGRGAAVVLPAWLLFRMGMRYPLFPPLLLRYCFEHRYYSRTQWI